MSESIDLEEILMNAPIAFGLVAQGKIPVIEEMLSNRKSLGEIAGVVGWDQEAMAVHYIAYLQNKIAKLATIPPAKGLIWSVRGPFTVALSFNCEFVIEKFIGGYRLLRNGVSYASGVPDLEKVKAHAESVHQAGWVELHMTWSAI